MRELPIPAHFDPETVGSVWRVPYEARASEAEAWASEHGIGPAADDARRVVLLAVDVQNTFCIPEFELFVGGRSGTGAVDDNRRLCDFVYRNLAAITRIVPTMDTHQAAQIFHAIFLIDDAGRHPAPFTLVKVEDVATGRWRFNPAIATELGIDAETGQRHLERYVARLAETGKYDLTVWPYHAMLGGIGHALVSAFEEAVFFHAVARASPPDVHVKGGHPLTEHYSVLRPEVNTGADGAPLVPDSGFILDHLATGAAMIVVGQAKSHCVAWTIADLIEDARRRDPALVGRIYVLEDCMSSVVIPGTVDYTDVADAAFREFREAGAHIVRSTEPMTTWPGEPLAG